MHRGDTRGMPTAHGPGSSIWLRVTQQRRFSFRRARLAGRVPAVVRPVAMCWRGCPAARIMSAGP